MLSLKSGICNQEKKTKKKTEDCWAAGILPQMRTAGLLSSQTFVDCCKKKRGCFEIVHFFSLNMWYVFQYSTVYKWDFLVFIFILCKWASKPFGVIFVWFMQQKVRLWFNEVELLHLSAETQSWMNVNGDYWLLIEKSYTTIILKRHFNRWHL